MTHSSIIPSPMLDGALFICFRAGVNEADGLGFRQRALSLGGVEFRKGLWLLDACGPAERLLRLLDDGICPYQTIIVINVRNPVDLAMRGVDAGKMQAYLEAVRPL